MYFITGMNRDYMFWYFSEELQQQAGVFKRSANELKNRMWWKNIKVGKQTDISNYPNTISMTQ